MSALLTADAILRDVAFLRAKPDNSHDAATSSDTASGAVDISGTPPNGGYRVPSYELDKPPIGRQYLIGATEHWPGRLPGNWVPSGYVARYPNAGITQWDGEPELIVDGELTPFSVSPVRYLIGLVSDVAFNITVGSSAVATPSKTAAYYAAATPYFFYAGYGTGVTHFNIVGPGLVCNYSWWHAGGGGPIL